jgi:hypothetical protein
VVAHADQAGPDLVLLGIPTQLASGLFIECRGRSSARLSGCPAAPFARSPDLTAAEAVEHRLLLGGIGSEVTAQKGIGVA